VAKLLGAQTTLQRFYALTAYGSIPLVLTGLGPIPCLGAVASVLGGIWAFIVYLAAVRVVTRMSLGYALVSVILPVAVVLLLGAMVAISLIATIMGFIF